MRRNPTYQVSGSDHTCSCSRHDSIHQTLGAWARSPCLSASLSRSLFICLGKTYAAHAKGPVPFNEGTVVNVSFGQVEGRDSKCGLRFPNPQLQLLLRQTSRQTCTKTVRKRFVPWDWKLHVECASRSGSSTLTHAPLATCLQKSVGVMFLLWCHTFARLPRCGCSRLPNL